MNPAKVVNFQRLSFDMFGALSLGLGVPYQTHGLQRLRKDAGKLEGKHPVNSRNHWDKQV